MHSFLEKYKKQLIILAGAAVAVFIYLFSIHDSTNNSTVETIDQMALAALEAPNAAQEPDENPIEPQNIIIDVKGAVKYPGVYTLSEEERIVDAIEAAGGYTDDANPVLINHAQKLHDEMVIYIPKVGEDASETMEQFLQVGQTNSASGGNSAGKINLNKATETELTQLPGIGPSKANAIIQHRTENGNFQVIEDLKQVTGIGEKTFEQLKDLVDVK
ncbi:helix-hairpin-helix domain-containing protein [Solibacillus silvestris]|uniref:helix-hairpin-helix domain-containing protein n=1 Tax=Solibacillus silvestris TaxID=76853 RepID=UPI003F7FF99C